MSNDVTYKEYQVIVRENKIYKYKDIFWYKPNTVKTEDIKNGKAQYAIGLHREDGKAYEQFDFDSKSLGGYYYLNGQAVQPLLFKEEVEKLNVKSSCVDEVIVIKDKKYKLIPVE